MKLKTIRQQVTFRATPHDVFEAYMDPVQHAVFTGAPAKISRKVGGAFAAYDGQLHGTTVELVRDRKIVQLWRSAEPDWPEGHFSRLTIALAPVKGGTRMTFVQTGVPSACFDAVRDGWREFYWGPMKELLSG